MAVAGCLGAPGETTFAIGGLEERGPGSLLAVAEGAGLEGGPLMAAIPSMVFAGPSPSGVFFAGDLAVFFAGDLAVFFAGGVTGDSFWSLSPGSPRTVLLV